MEIFSFTAQIINVSDNIEKILSNSVKMSNLKCKFKAVSPVK